MIGKELRIFISTTVLSIISIFGIVTSLLYVYKGWPFEGPTRLNCSLRLAHTSLLISPAQRADIDVTAPRALELDPRDLMAESRWHTERGQVMRLIHQSWKNRSVPQHMRRWSDTWRVYHPNWRYVLWTDSDNLELIKRFYPDYLDSYLTLPSEIYRADMIRNCYLHRFGGIYADLDVEALRPLDRLLDDPTLESDQVVAHVARMATTRDAGALLNSIPNAFMASSAPGHPFWLKPLNYVVNHLAEHADQPEWLTGPVPLTKLSLEHAMDGQYLLRMHPPHLIFPFSWDVGTPYQRCVCSAQSPALNTGRCKDLFGDAYAVTYWWVISRIDQ